MPQEQKEPERSTLAKYLRYSHVGLQFFLAVGLFTAGGLWLDRRLGTVVLFTLTGLAIGFAGGFIALQRELFPRRDPEKKEGNKSGHSKPPRQPD